MSSAVSKEQIREALAKIYDGNFRETSVNLLKVLGYGRNLTLPDQTGDGSYFAKNPDIKSGQLFLENTQSGYALIQVTNNGIRDIENQELLLSEEALDESNDKSFLFCAVEMNEARNSYPRGIYAELAREVNKPFPMPTVVLFKTSGNLLTLAFVHRRRHRFHPDRDVLGAVSLIREINTGNPHISQLDVLTDLSLNHRSRWMKNKGKPENFDSLLEAWLEALDTEALNSAFYKDMFDWFENAVEAAKFQDSRSASSEEHMIRLITRLLFVWFVKEKGLVADELFIEEKISSLLKNYDRNTGDSYYRAILQNLFFGTFNTEIHQRRFHKTQKSAHRDCQYYRFENEIADTDSLLGYFLKTPFINGGLFDCLDNVDSHKRSDCCCSDNVITPGEREYGIISVPNKLFFGETGLIDMLNRYKFTVQENTPIEKEVALDPELLGKVFENLLAAYNPETRATARKQSGSYYTPRPVVDYMVCEALVSFLSEKVPPKTDDSEDWKARLRCLFYYDDAFNDNRELFDMDETRKLYQAITTMKILDPAVGSGAFPVSVLLKLTLALERLEYDEPGSDLDRKLRLIQNNIFGVDIQPIAIQISQLRLFILLVIEQDMQLGAYNYGIKPIPNLETQFAVSNFLIGLRTDRSLYSSFSQSIVQQIRDNRQKYFNASTRVNQSQYINNGTDLRNELAKELENSGFQADDARKVASWTPYDQNTDTKWFDPRYMFGVDEGFDIIIANPPYVESRNSLMSDRLKDLYGQQVVYDWKMGLPRGSDLLIYFYARSAKLLHNSGVGCFITQNAWLTTNYGKKFQSFVLERFAFHSIIDSSSKFFPDHTAQNINTVITIFGKQDRHKNTIKYGIVDEKLILRPVKSFSPRQVMKWGHIIAMPDFMMDILSDMSKVSDSSKANILSFGQGLNFRKSNLDLPDATIPILVNSHQFIAYDANRLCRAEDARRDKIPALVMPRGIGDRYYCTLNLCNAFSYSGVELYLPSDLMKSDIHYCLWMYLNSSFVWLYREVTGRKNLGGGLLKAEATDMKSLPIGFTFNFASEAKQISKQLSEREPMKVEGELYSNEHLLIDEIVSDYFGFTDYQNTIRDTLVEQVTLRTGRPRR